MSTSTQTFAEQVSVGNYLLALTYIIATAGVLLGALAAICIDAGLVRRELLVETITQKFAAFFIGAASFAPIGYAIWNVQYYEGMQVAQPLAAAIHDWALWGTNMRTSAKLLDPKLVPNAEMYQVFYAFFLCFAGLCAVLIHGGGLERIGRGACYATSVVVGSVLIPVIAYLTYGSASPLTNAGLHDFVGAYSLYIAVGVWSLILAWRLGHRQGGLQDPGSYPLLWLGVVLLVVAIPLFVIGCGFVVPDVGYFGPTYADAGLGLVFINVFMALIGGGLGGAAVARWVKSDSYIFLGPVAGYVACTAIFDIASGFEALVAGCCGPFLLLAGGKLVRALGIDEPKVAPLTILPATFSGVLAGFIGQGRKQGGIFGVETGDYAFQHATVSVQTQLLGVFVVVVVAAILALVTTGLIERTIGLRRPQSGS